MSATNELHDPQVSWQTVRSAFVECPIIDIRPYHYENTPIQIYWEFCHQKIENFQMKNSNIFHISVQNIDCGYSLEPPRRGGSNEYPQSMFWAEIWKITYTHCKPQFYYIKWGLRGSKLYRYVFVMMLTVYEPSLDSLWTCLWTASENGLNSWTIRNIIHFDIDNLFVYRLLPKKPVALTNNALFVQGNTEVKNVQKWKLAYVFNHIEYFDKVLYTL